MPIKEVGLFTDSSQFLFQYNVCVRKKLKDISDLTYQTPKGIKFLRVALPPPGSLNAVCKCPTVCAKMILLQISLFKKF